MVADVRGRRRLDLRERVARGARMRTVIRSPAFSCDGPITVGTRALPEQEDRAVVVGERLVERLAEHRLQRLPVAARHVQGDVAAGLRPGDAADEEPSGRPPFGAAWSATAAACVLSICWSDEPCGARICTRDEVALLEVGGGADVRHAVRPDQDRVPEPSVKTWFWLGPDQCLQRRPVAGLDLDRDAAGVRAG